MRNKLLVAIVIAILAVVPFSGKALSQTDNDLLIGVWQSDEFDVNSQDLPPWIGGIAFYPDGKVYIAYGMGMGWGTYTPTSNYLRIQSKQCQLGPCVDMPGNIRYEVGDTSLTLWLEDWYDGQPHSFDRVRNISWDDLNQCANTPPSHMLVGFGGYVAYTNGQPARLRNNPTTQAELIAHIDEGTDFGVVGGPKCADGLTWWQVEMSQNGQYPGLKGWSAEGDFESYWLHPWPATSSYPNLLPTVSYQGPGRAESPTALNPTAQPTAVPQQQTPPPTQVAEGEIFYQNYDFDDSPPKWSIWQLFAPPAYADEVTCPGGIQTHPGFDHDQCTALVVETYPLALCWLKKPAHAYLWPQQVEERGAAFGFSIVSDPQTGDIVVWDRSCQSGKWVADPNHGHVGVVKEVNADGTIDVLERNANHDEKIARENVPIVDCMTFIRPPSAGEMPVITLPPVQEPKPNVFQRLWKFVTDVWSGFWGG